MPTDIPPQDFSDNLFILWEETFGAPHKPGGTAYLDQLGGWSHTLDGIPAEEASRPAAPGGTTIAAQTAHAYYFLGAVLDEIEGRLSGFDWPGSWHPAEVDEAGWEELKHSFKEQVARVEAALRATEDWHRDRVGVAMLFLVHSAYHLGSVRQMIKVVR